MLQQSRRGEWGSEFLEGLLEKRSCNRGEWKKTKKLNNRVVYNREL
jgi:hypothetical protein